MEDASVSHGLIMVPKSTYSYESFNRDDKNVFGALLFLSYIVAALYFSLCTWRIIRHRYTFSRAKMSSRTLRKVVLAAATTLLSFLVLSYNMLSFLILSYNDWAQRFGIHGNPLLHPTLLWQWMSHATLFEDFARSLVATPARSLWTQVGLLQTYKIVTKLYRGVWSRPSAWTEDPRRT